MVYDQKSKKNYWTTMFFLYVALTRAEEQALYYFEYEFNQ
jgi:ATP-dependent exoDNAse (exonuclease V) beta subunit